MCDSNINNVSREANLNSDLAPVSGSLAYLKDPSQTPQTIILVGTAPQDSTKNNFFIDDSCGLASQIGSVGTSTGIEFVAGASIVIANIKEYLKTNALIITGYNFQSTLASALTSQNLKAIYSSLDGNQTSRQLFSSPSASMMANNQNLLNVSQNFVWSNTCALRIPVTPNSGSGGSVVYTLTFIVKASVPYGKLPEYLALAKISETSRVNC